MKTMLRWTGLIGIILAASSPPCVADDAEEAKRLEGTWKFVSLNVDGAEAPPAFVEKGRWIFRGKELVIPGPGGGKGSIAVDPGRSPRTIDMTGVEGEGKGKTVEGIYKLEGERLTLCLAGGRNGPSRDGRPGEFGTGKGRSLLVLERIKGE